MTNMMCPVDTNFPNLSFLPQPELASQAAVDPTIETPTQAPATPFESQFTGQPVAQMLENNTLFTMPSMLPLFTNVTRSLSSYSEHFQFLLNSSSEEIKEFNNKERCTNQMVLNGQCVVSQLNSASLSCSASKIFGYFLDSSDLNCTVSLLPENKNVTNFPFKKTNFEQMRALLQSNFPTLQDQTLSIRNPESLAQYAQKHPGVTFLRKMEVISTAPKEQARALFDPVHNHPNLENPDVINNPINQATLRGFCNQHVTSQMTNLAANCSYQLKIDSGITPVEHRIGQFTNRLLNTSYLSATNPAILDNYQDVLTSLKRPVERISDQTLALAQKIEKTVEQGSGSVSHFGHFQPNITQLNASLNKANYCVMTLLPLGLGSYFILEGAKYIKKSIENNRVALHRRVAAAGAGIINMSLGLGIMAGGVTLTNKLFKTA